MGNGLKSMVGHPSGNNGNTSSEDRVSKNNHPTVKPIALMEYLIKMVTRTGGIVLDPFIGSGTTGIAAIRSGNKFVGCEQSEEYCQIANHRIQSEMNNLFEAAK